MHFADVSRRFPLPAILVLASIFVAGCAGKPPLTEPYMVREGGEEWVEHTIANLTLDEKIGQMILSRAYGYYVSSESDEYRRLEHLVRERRVGGFVFFQGEVLETAVTINRLQEQSALPLLIASDFEWGSAMRIRRGTRFPEAMALGASRDTVQAFNMGFAIAREARAMGVHMVLSPVADVNNNPENPVINTRSFGENPVLVGSLASAFARGVASAGGIATAKHFPGHGDTKIDSHVQLPIVDASRERLDSVELLPYRRLITEGLQSIMIAHIFMPALETNTSLPATLSENVVNGLLRREMGYDGLIMTDALDMGAIVNRFGSDSSAVYAVEAGVDILLILPDEDAAMDALRNAVTTGRIPLSRIDASVRRILRMKYNLGLAQNRVVDIGAISSRIATPAHLTLARSIGRSSITVLRNDGVIPLDRTRKGKTLVVLMSDAEHYRTEIHRPASQWPNEPVGDYFLSQLRRRIGPVDVHRLDPSANAMDIDSMIRRGALASAIIVPVFSKARSGSGTAGLAPVFTIAAESLRVLNKPTIAIAMGSPYTLSLFDSASAYVCAYSDCEASTEAVVEVLTGESGSTAALPVSIPERFGVGEGLLLKQEYLRRDSPESAGMDPYLLARVDSLMMQAIADSVFPGAQIAVIRNGALVMNAAFGRQQYAQSSPLVVRSTLFDLASLTKVIATTPAIMRLVDDTLLFLDDPVMKYIPEFANNGKEKITIRNLLLHNGGLPAFKRLFLTCSTPAQAMDSVYQTELIYRTGDSTVYSDFDFILLGEIVKRVTGVALDRYADSVFFKPLGMTRTMFNPPSRSQFECMPTEYDGAFRRKLVQGSVHDENAYLLGGVSGHAGLFSSATDLTVFLQMIINGGSYGGVRYLSAATVAEFTRRQSPESSRGLGWDMKSENGYSSAGTLMGTRTFGHTGFTGTSVWIDPMHNVCVILLTNRVHPTRSNGRISAFRPRIHDAVMRAVIHSETRDVSDE